MLPLKTETKRSQKPNPQGHNLSTFMTQASVFKGFPAETHRFIRGIRKNNTKEWFDAHRSDYDEHFVAVAKGFVEAIGPRLAKLAPKVVAIPKINGSIFRINRDVRFSTDKRPYKDHLDFRFWEGEKKTANSAFFLRLSPDALYIGTGNHMTNPDQLKSLRKAVADEPTGSELAAIAKNLRKQGYEIDGKHYKRIPRDFPEDCPAAEFLLHNSLYVVHQEKAKIASQADLLNICIKHWKTFARLHHWLTANL